MKKIFKLGIIMLSGLILNVISYTAQYRTEVTKIGSQENQIYGIRYIPNVKGKVPLIIFGHELGGTHENMEKYAKILAEQGIASYIFDFRGGSVKSQSTGKKTTEMSLITEVNDMEKVLSESKKWNYVNQNKIIILGGSQGGVVSALTAARNVNKIAGLILLYPAYVIEDDVHNFAPSKDKIPAEFTMRGWIKVGANYFSDIYDMDLMKESAKYTKPVLILHGTLDPHVPVIKSEKLQKTYNNAKLVLIEGAEHSFLEEPFFSQVVSQIDKYLKDNGIKN